MMNGWFGFLAFFNIFVYIGLLVFGIYAVLQFLKLNRERNDCLRGILEELKKEDRPLP